VVDALRTGIRLSGAVATAHAAGILHRDIKPANVLTNDYGWPALTDFGIASDFADSSELPTLDGASGTGASGSGSGSGDPEASVGMSVPWSPPEMFGDFPSPDVRSDIFSLAATIHTVLAGRTPFEVPGGPNGTLDLIARIERGEVTPLQRDDVPAALAAVLAKGMSPRRENRYPTVIDFARALQRVELELGYAPTTIELPIADEEPRERPAGDETRIRAVPEVLAQVPASSPTLVAAPIAAEPAPSGQFSPASRRRILVAGLVGLLAILAILAIALAVTLGGAAVRQPTAPTPRSTGGSAIVGPSVPQPTNGVAQPSADGTSVDFSWTDPKPKTGDIFYWARSETPDDRQATPTPGVTVTGVVPGSKVCINVEIGRAGATGDPLVICTS
jgi:hypothetical protein